MTIASHSKHPSVQKITISADVEGQRIDNFLFTYLKGVPKTRIYRIIRKGEIRINQGRVKPDYRLCAGDLLRIPPVRRDESKPEAMVPHKNRFVEMILEQIIFEDDGLIILNKPAGMAVHGGSGVSFGVIEALRHLRTQDKMLELVHRLDRDTSGCLMIAKKRSILKAIHEQLQNATVEKVYWALVKGPWLGEKEVRAPLKKNQLSSGERIVKVSTDGQPSLTEFKILKEFSNTTLMEAKPKTGRTHQIRVHSTFVGNPIVGDPKYGDPQFNQMMKAKGITRLFLHARKITLNLPQYEKEISVEAPLDNELQVCLNRLAEEKKYV